MSNIVAHDEINTLWPRINLFDKVPISATIHCKLRNQQANGAEQRSREGIQYFIGTEDQILGDFNRNIGRRNQKRKGSKDETANDGYPNCLFHLHRAPFFSFRLTFTASIWSGHLCARAVLLWHLLRHIPQRLAVARRQGNPDESGYNGSSPELWPNNTDKIHV